MRFRRPPGSTELLLVRHGESEPMVPGRPFPLVDGHGDPELAPDGRRQAELVADAPRRATRSTPSTSRRCAAPQQTAAPLAARLGIEPVVEPDLREVHLGEWEGELYRKHMAEGHPLALKVHQRAALGRHPRRRVGGVDPRPRARRPRPHRRRPPRAVRRRLQPRRDHRRDPRPGHRGRPAVRLPRRVERVDLPGRRRSAGAGSCAASTTPPTSPATSTASRTSTRCPTDPG